MYLKNRYILTLLLLWAVCSAFGGPRLKDLTVYVSLQDNGDARITEVRDMEVDDTGTECYIVISNTNGSVVRDLEVRDETDTYFDTSGSWDINGSRSAKTHCAVILEKNNGYEICWGLGDSGNRTYHVSYTLTTLVRSYQDYDGFNYMFVASQLNPHAEHARVVINKEDGAFTEEDVRMWAFRFRGDVNLIDGKVVAETTGELDAEHAMIVMLQFEKEVFHPRHYAGGSFEEVKERAFKYSDYIAKRSITDWLKEIASWLIGALVFLSIPLFLLWRYIQVWRFRKAVNKDLLWYRDFPYNGNLLYANQVIDASYYKSRNTKNLISACVLRLISVGAIRIEPLQDHPDKSAFVIGNLKRVRGFSDTKMLRLLYGIFAEAADEDGILQPKELQKWMKRHEEYVVEFMAEASQERSLKECKKDIDRCRQVFGLKQFLIDFTLANERSAVEVALWKDYLVYAELFGIAKQVRKDMQRINPEYFKMDDIYRSMFNEKELPELFSITQRYANKGGKALRDAERRSSGGGGSASMSGGDGYSGGGSGGGIR